MSKKSETAADRADAIKELRKLVKPGQVVYTVLKHVSGSGMSRVIDVVIPYRDYRLEYPLKPEDSRAYPTERDYAAKPKRVFVGLKCRSISWLVGRATGYKVDRDRGGLKVGGCGMDMGFSVVYDMGRVLWPKGTPKPHGMRNGGPDREGGYALKHEWLG